MPLTYLQNLHLSFVKHFDSSTRLPSAGTYNRSIYAILYKSKFILTFGVSIVKQKYDYFLWLERNRKNLEWYKSKKIPIEIQNMGRRKLRMLNNSQDLADLKIPPSNRLEKLTGKLNEFYSIRINKQWRIIFIWEKGNAGEVAIIDYH